MNKKFKSNIQLEELPEKLRKLTETNAANELHTFIKRIQKEKCKDNLNIVISGNGDNYAAALCSKQLLIEKYHITSPIIACSTSFIVSNLRQDITPNFDLVICIDFDGNSNDTEELVKLCVAYDYHFLLITALPECQFDKNIYLNDFKNCIISCDYFELLVDCFPHILSYTATLAPITLFNDDTYQNYWHIYEHDLKRGRQFVERLDIRDITVSLSKSPIIHVFYEYSTEPTAHDIKHKFEAAGIANVMLHEKTCFITGDANILLKGNIGLIINLIKYNGNSKYNRNIDSFLYDFCFKNDYNCISFGSMCSEFSKWNINAMMMLPYLITAIGNELNIDVANPEKQITKEETQQTYR